MHSSYKIRPWKWRIFACGIDLHVIIKALLMYFSRDGGWIHVPVSRALRYVKTALHCALHNEFQKIQLLIVVSYWGTHSPNEICKYLSLTLTTIVSSAPKENSAFCLAMAVRMKMPLQLLKKFAFMMLIVLTAFGIIYRIGPVPFWPVYFLALDCYNKLLNIFLYPWCQNAEKGSGC